MSLSQNYPTTRPTLTLDFAKAKRVDPRVTFTRASTATYFDASGTLRSAADNVPRIDFNPSTLLCQGLLIEESRTNSLLQSEDFATTWGLNSGTITTNAATAPSGTVTADELTTNGTSVQVSQGVTVSSGATVTGGCFLKQNGLTTVEIVLLSDNNTTPYGRATFNVSTGVISVAAATANGGTNASAAITNVGNGWYRCSVTVTYPAVTAAGMRIFSAGATGSVYAWGAQLEAGAFATSYIPTTTTALTRAADVASVNTLSPWFNASEGTLFAEVQRYALIPSGAFYNAWSISDNTNNERFIGYNTGSTQGMDAAVTDGGSPQATLLAPGTITANTTIKTALAYAVNDFAFVRDAGVVQTDTSGTLPTVSRLYIGANSIGTGQWTSYIRRITYYPRKLSSAELQAITA